MTARTVHAPDGATWKVERRWVKRNAIRWWSLPKRAIRGGLWADLIGPFIIAFATLVGLLVSTARVCLDVALTFVRHFLLGKPWLVEARAAPPFDVVLAWRVHGWRRSGEVVEEVARQLLSGVPEAEIHPVGAEPVTPT